VEVGLHRGEFRGLVRRHADRVVSLTRVYAFVSGNDSLILNEGDEALFLQYANFDLLTALAVCADEALLQRQREGVPDA
jgi:hypothetical protein